MREFTQGRCNAAQIGAETMTVKEIGSVLRIGTNSAYNLIHSNAFPVIRIGNSYRVPAEPFYAWLNHSCNRCQ